MIKVVGIIGLGTCGMPAARRFLGQGYRVYGYDLRQEAIQELERLGGHPVNSPAQVAQKAGYILVLVMNQAQASEVVCGGNGILAGAGEGSTIVGMSTISQAGVEENAACCADKGVFYVDCPFTGGPARIDDGSITMIAAASESVLQNAMPHLSQLGQVVVVGREPGMGQAVKHCNQLLVAAVHVATVEMLTLAGKSGLDLEQVVQVVGSGIAGNNYFDLLTGAILNGTASPASVELFWKDVNLVAQSAAKQDLPLLLTSAMTHYFNMAKAQGRIADDAKDLMQVIERMIEK
jgi:3-hydroxyisobutyrate dehydrogenase-like beta-hydroxyacid dehydrogenase